MPESPDSRNGLAAKSLMLVRRLNCGVICLTELLAARKFLNVCFYYGLIRLEILRR